MPVIRKRERIRVDYAAGGATPTSRIDVAKPATDQASMAARRAYDFSRTMAAAAAREGEKLAKAASLHTDADGNLTLPDSTKMSMGRIMRESYDGAMFERYGFQVTTAVKAEFEAAESANLYDMDGYEKDTSDIIAKWGDKIDPRLHGMFQDVVAGQKAAGGASIGRRVGTAALANQRAQMPHMVQVAGLNIGDLIRAGEDEAAKALVDGSWIDSVGPEIATDAEKAEYKDKLQYAAANALMMRELDVVNMNSQQLDALRADLISGENEKLNALFTNESGVTRTDLMKQSYNTLGVFYADAQRKTARQKESLEFQGNVYKIANGMGTGTPTERSDFDKWLGVASGLSTAEGGSRPMQPADWYGLDEDALNTLIPTIKSAGFVPDSLQKAFRQAGNSGDPARMAALFPIIRQLENAPNNDGQVMALLEDVPANVLSVYEHVKTHHGSGTANDETIVNATAQAMALLDQDWTDQDMVRKLEADSTWSGSDSWLRVALPLIGGQPVRKTTVDTVQQDMRRAAIPDIFEDIDALDVEKDEAMAIVNTHLRLGETFETSVKIAKQQMEGRYVDSKYFGALTRSAWAPEKHYKDPGPQRLGSAIASWGDQTVARTAQLREFLTEAPWMLLPGDLPQWLEVDYGADEMLASPFDLMVDTSIRKMLAQRPELSESFDTGRGLFQAQRDYKLIPDKSAGSTLPVYKVSMRGPEGAWVPLGVVDVREPWKQYMEFTVNVERMEKMAFRRGLAMRADELVKAATGVEFAEGMGNLSSAAGEAAQYLQILYGGRAGPRPRTLNDEGDPLPRGSSHGGSTK